MIDGLTAAVSGSAECLVVQVAGELDVATAPSLWGAVGGLFERSSAASHEVRLDLARLTFCDSSGIAVFLRLADAARDAGVHLVFRNPQPMMRRLFALSGVDAYLDVGESGLESTG